MTESIFQQTLVQQIKIIYPDILLVQSMSGIHLHGNSKQKAQTLATMKREGFRKGIADISLMLPKGLSIHLELKTQTGVQSKEQKEVEQILHKLQHFYYVVRSTDEVLDAIAKHTTLEYRRSCLEALIDLTQPLLLNDLMLFKRGTPTKEVETMLREKYRL